VTSTPFDHSVAFSRSLGWLSEDELKKLQNSTVAIAGMGGVGGAHLLTLARLGIGHFHLADFDSFELPNFNRQAGSGMSTLGRNKLDVMIEKALDINPDLKITKFSDGLNSKNIADFFKDVDLYVDGLDFFCFDLREEVFAYLHTHNIPATTVAPIGMGAALVNFLPGQMSFAEYFGFSQATTEYEKAILFVIGLSPSAVQRKYLVAPSHVNLKAHRVPSLPMSCEISAGVAGTEALKILLGRGGVKAAPHSFQFDAYYNRMIHRYMPWGYKNPLQRLKFFILRKANL